MLYLPKHYLQPTLMIKQEKISKTNRSLREKAENKVDAPDRASGEASINEMSTKKLIYELEVHQIELQMQNEELTLAKEEAELAKEKYSQLYNFAPIGYLCLTRDGRICELNFSAANLLGKDRTALMNRLFSLYVSKETRPIFNQFLDSVFDDETKQSCEVIIETESNSPIYVSLSGNICQSGNYCLLNVFDITERKLAEVARIQGEERYKRITTDLTDYLYSVKIRNGQAVETIHDETCLEITGYTSKEFAESSNLWYNIIFPEDTRIVLDAITKITKSRTSISIEHRIICKNGQTRWIRNVLIPKFNETNDLVSYDGVVKDISVLKQTTQALKESETKFKEIINQICDAIIVFNEEEEIVIWNKGAEQIFGSKTEEVLGASIVDIQYQFSAPQYKDKQRIASTIREIRTQQNSPIFNKIIDYETVNISGKLQNSQCIIFPIKLEGSNLYCTVIRDTTEKKMFEKTLIQLNADKDRFLAILAHDLKSPFNAILGFLELLENNIRSYEIEKTEKFVSIINDSAKNTYRLLDDILMWVRANSNNIPYRPQHVSFITVCDKINENLQLIAKSKKITISFNKQDEDRTIFADQNMLETILRNLVSNAIKFTHTGGKVEIDAKFSNCDVTITVKDNGIGINQATIEKLFLIKNIITTTGTANEKGTGLGLMICKELVERMKGKIWVESEVGKGTNFKFTLPTIE